MKHIKDFDEDNRNKMKGISLYERLHIQADDPDQINFEENKIEPVYQRVIGNY